MIPKNFFGYFAKKNHHNLAETAESSHHSDWDSLAELGENSNSNTTFDDLAEVPFAGDAGSIVDSIDRESPQKADSSAAPEHHPVLEVSEQETPASSPEIQAFRDFFKTDLRIKRELMQSAPSPSDDYDETSRMKYVDSAYRTFEAFRDDFAKISQSYGYAEGADNFFKRGATDFVLSRYEAGDIEELYRHKFSDLRPEFVEKVKQNTVGYKLLNSFHSVLANAQAVNELLHAYHSYITNNEHILQGVPAIAEKVVDGDETITLRGDESSLARQIFDSIPEDFKIGTTDIVAAGENIMMMVRDRGHALTLSAEPDSIKTDQMWVEYNIPKICNAKMIEALPGLSGYTKNGARGGFFAPREDFGPKIVDFIAQVPTDRDMPSYQESFNSSN